MIIISTTPLWKTRVGNVVHLGDVGKAYKDAQSKLNRIPAVQTRKICHFLSYMSSLMANKMSVRDGTQPLQATRSRWFRTSSSATAPRTRVEHVIDQRHAWSVAVDEIHTAASADTLTYRQVIDPIIAGCGPARAPGIIGITGTSLYGGASLIMTFARKVCLAVCDRSSTELSVQSLLDVKDVNFDAT